MKEAHLYNKDDAFLKIAEKTDDAYKALVNELYDHLRSNSNSYLGLDFAIDRVADNMSFINNIGLASLIKADLQKKMDDEMKHLKIEK